MIAKKIVVGIMEWDAACTQVRSHSGRTDSDFGHHNYLKVSGTSPYR